MDTLIQDIRFASRRLLKSPGFTAVAVLTLALGIGANSAIFSVVNGVLLRSLPLEEADRLVTLFTDYDDGRMYPLSPPDFMSFREGAGAFENVVAFNSSNTATLTGTDEPTQLRAAWVSDGFFELLRVRPVLGRTLRPEENLEGQTNVAVLGHGLWQRQFGSDPDVLGETITLNGVVREVVGVLPAGFDYPDGRDLYLPLPYNEQFDAATASGRRGEYISTLARLEDGVPFERAEAEAEALSLRLREDFPETNARTMISLIPLREQLLGGVRTPLLVLLGAVGLVLLIACANVANLLLARAAAREGEFAVRTALGAGRGRLVRQLLTESLLLGVLGGVFGLVLAVWGTQALIASPPAGMPRIDEIGIDGAVLAFTAAIVLATSILFGLAPGLQATGGRMAGALKEGGRGGLTGPGGRRLRGGLVVAEMALAVMLLVGSGLLIHSFLKLTAVDPGFDAESVVTFNVSLPTAVYDEEPPRAEFFRQLLEGVEALPGVRSASASTGIPLRGAGTILSFSVEGREPPAPGETPEIIVKTVTPEYFRTLGIPLVHGRGFEASDRYDSPPVAVLNQAAVDRFFPDEDPLEQGITFGEEPLRIVGVAADVRQRGLHEEAAPELYAAHSQFPSPSMTVAVRTAGDPLALTGALRAEVRALDPNLPVQQFTTAGEIVAESVAQPRFYMLLLTIFAAVALLLAAIGIFGVMSYTVVQQTREIGIRLALGAAPGNVLGLVVRKGAILAGLGLVLGLFGAFAASRLLASLLYGVSTTDTLTFVAVPVVLGAVALVASWLPARRATRVDPMIALRAE